MTDMNGHQKPRTLVPSYNSLTENRFPRQECLKMHPQIISYSRARKCTCPEISEIPSRHYWPVDEINWQNENDLANETGLREFPKGELYDKTKTRYDDFETKKPKTVPTKRQHPNGNKSAAGHVINKTHDETTTQMETQTTAEILIKKPRMVSTKREHPNDKKSAAKHVKPSIILLVTSQIIHILTKPLYKVIFLSVLCLFILPAYGKPTPYCKYTSTPKAMCYCVNCPDYKTCLQLCHDNLEGKPEVIKLQEGNFPIIQKNSTSSMSLERLTLSNCQIREMAPDFFEPYPNLLRFAVFDNKLEDSDAPLHLNLTNNQALTRVELFSNSLTKLPRIRSESLEYLDVRFNSISSLQPEDLQALKKLKTLDLGDNHLTTIGPFEVGHLQQVHLLNNDFPCTSATYCDFHRNRDYIVADYGVYCKYNNTALTRFADEDGLLPDFHCPAPKKNVTKSQFLIENETTKIHDSVRSRSEFRLYPSPICVISVPLLIGHFNLSWISH